MVPLSPFMAGEAGIVRTEVGGTRWRLKAKKLVKRRRTKVPSVSGQMGQHSPSGMMGSAHSDVSSQITSSHMTVPLSQTQIWQGSGFHTSLSLYNCPPSVQLPNVPDRRQQPSLLIFNRSNRSNMQEMLHENSECSCEEHRHCQNSWLE